VEDVEERQTVGDLLLGVLVVVGGLGGPLCGECPYGVDLGAVLPQLGADGGPDAAGVVFPCDEQTVLLAVDPVELVEPVEVDAAITFRPFAYRLGACLQAAL